MRSLKLQLTQAVRAVNESLLEAEEKRRELLGGIQKKTRSKARETLEQSPEARQVAERIDRLVLFQQLLRNVRMNLLEFEKGGLNLRLNQLNSIRKLVEFLQAEGQGGTSGYIKQPTGAGKTVLFGVLTRLCSVPTLILVPKTNLLTQTKRELVEVVGIPEEEIGLLGGGNNEYDQPIRIVTYQSHRSLMKRDKEYREQIQSCKLIICDEAHRSLGERTQESIESLDGEFDDLLSEEEQAAEEDVLAHFKRYTPARALKLGFTATPKLAEKHVEDAFGPMIAEEKHADLIKAGILVPYRIIQANGVVTEIDLEEYLSIEKEIEILRRENTYRKLLGKYVDVLAEFNKAKHKRDYPLRGIAFCVKISECDRFAHEAEELGLRARILTSRETKGMNGDECNAILKSAESQLLRNEIDIIVTVTKLAEGWNFPPANAVIWARASQSPALIIQGVGRTARSYEDTKKMKKAFSYVFETKWNSIEDNAWNKPLCIADAMAQMGETPQECCENLDGTPLQYELILRLDEKGEVDIGGRIAVGLKDYAKFRSVDIRRIRKLAEELSEIPFACALNGSRHIPLYWKEKLESRLPPVPDERGIVSISGREAVSIFGYSKYQDVHFVTLAKRIENEGIKPIPNIETLRGGQLYWKDEIDHIVPFRVNENGEVDINGRIAISVQRYSAIHGPNYATLQSWINAAGIQPIDFEIFSGKSSVVIGYWKDEVLPLYPHLLDENGVTQVEGRDTIAIKPYAKAIGCVSSTIERRILETGLKPIQGVQGKTSRNRLDLYWKSEIDEVMIPKLNDQGIGIIEDMEVVGIYPYIGRNRADDVKKLLEQAKIDPLQNIIALSGSRRVQVFSKVAVDEVLKKYFD